MRNGEGEYHWTTGMYHKGTYVDGERYGKGVQYYPDGQIIKGDWRSDFNFTRE